MNDCENEHNARDPLDAIHYRLCAGLMWAYTPEASRVPANVMRAAESACKRMMGDYSELNELRAKLAAVEERARVAERERDEARGLLASIWYGNECRDSAEVCDFCCESKCDEAGHGGCEGRRKAAAHVEAWEEKQR